MTKDRQRLSDLYPGGWVAVPLALLKQPGAKAGHRAVMAALMSLARFRNGKRVAFDVRNRRLRERSGVGTDPVLRAITADLSEWGYVEVHPVSGYGHTYVLLTVETDVSNALADDAIEDEEQRPDVAAHRGGRARTNPQRENPPGVSGEQGRTPEAKPTPPSARERSAPPIESASGGSAETPPLHKKKKKKEDEIESWCASAHRLLCNPVKVSNLMKAVDKKNAFAALKEVNFRLCHTEVTEAVTDPWALARKIAECYRGNCGTNHPGVHGEAARKDHAGRRADVAQQQRAEKRVNPRLTDYDPDVAELKSLQQEKEVAKARIAEYKKGIGFGID